jgi:hypothetical protein
VKRIGVVFVFVALAALLYLATSTRRDAPRARFDPSASDASDGAVPNERHTEMTPRPSDVPTTPLDRTVRDRVRRDEVRRQIFLAWSHAASVTPTHAEAPAADPLHAPMPTLDGGSVDPDYLRARIREDFLPMAAQCYDQWTARAPGASAGRVVADFVILGDEHVGGVVDEVTLESPERDAGPDAAVLGDGEFQTCLRESMMAMAFQAPPGRGRLRVRYPFRFAPGDGGSSTPSP